MAKELKVLPTDDEMWEKWLEQGSAKRAAVLLEIKEWRVQEAITRRGKAAQMEALETKGVDLAFSLMTAAKESIGGLEPWRKFNAARDWLEVLRKFLVGDGKSGTQNIQNIIIGAKQAESLKATMESVEGEVIDDPDA